MSAEVLQPLPNQTIVRTSDDHHRDRHDGGHPLVEAILREQAAGFRTAASDHTDTIADIKDSRHDGIEATNRAAAAASLASCKTDDAIGSATDKLLGAITHGTEKVGDDYASLQKQISDAATATVVGFKDAQATAYQIQGNGLLEAAKNAAAITVQATNNFNLLNVQATQNRNDILLDSTKNAAASTLLATQLAATAAAQLAECCCELREKIRADGDTTRALINENIKESLRDRASRAEAALAAYYARNAAPVVP